MHNKNNKSIIKIVVIILAVFFIALTAFIFLRPDNIERAAKGNNEISSIINNTFDASYADVIYDGNRIVIENRIAENLSNEDAEGLVKLIKEDSSIVDDTVVPMLKEIKEVSGIDKATVEIVYYDTEGKEMLVMEYK